MTEWKEVPCKCNFTPTENPDEYEVYMMTMCTSKIYPDYVFTKKKTLRCKTCKDISIISRGEIN